MPPEKSTFDNLAKTKWTPATSPEHFLGSLQGKNLGSHKLLILIGPKSRFGATYFQVFLKNELGEISQQPVMIGLHNQGGYPAQNWIEITSFTQQVHFGSGEQVTFNVSSNDKTLQLFKHLADLLPPGGHIMVEYDSPSQQDTAKLLGSDIPPIATPLGYTLFLAGCGASFRDWYFAEGGEEGPRKLQGYKALNSKYAKIKVKETIRELSDYLNRPSSGAVPQLEKAARDRALVILKTLSAKETST